MAFDPCQQPRKQHGGVGVEQYSHFVDEKSETPRDIGFNYDGLRFMEKGQQVQFSLENLFERRDG